MAGSHVLKLSRGQKAVAHLTLILLSIPALLPLLWMVSTSLKTDSQIFLAQGKSAAAISLAGLMPHPFHWRNYPDALRAVPFGDYLRNTLLLCLLNVLGAVLSSAVVAYGFARLQFRGRDALFLLMISTMALPEQVTMIPNFTLFRMLHWYGTYLPLVVPNACGVPFYIFLLTQFYRSLPIELSEAARVDGANEWQILTRLFLPLSKPALATCALFQFLATWNDLFGPLLYLNDPSRYTLAYGLQQFLAYHGAQWAQLMAASTLFTVPILLLFFLTQRVFIEGIATTGVKG